MPAGGGAGPEQFRVGEVYPIHVHLSCAYLGIPSAGDFKEIAPIGRRRFLRLYLPGWLELQVALQDPMAGDRPIVAAANASVQVAPWIASIALLALSTFSSILTVDSPHTPLHPTRLPSHFDANA